MVDMKRVHPMYIRKWLIEQGYLVSDRGRITNSHIDDFNKAHRREGLYYEPFPRNENPSDLLYGGPGLPVKRNQTQRNEEWVTIRLRVPKGTIIETE